VSWSCRERARSTYYDEPKSQPIEEALLIGQITEIRAEFPRYGYRRVAAQLREDGIVVNHKKVMRLMKEHGLTVQPRRRYVVTTDSDHDGPIFPSLAKHLRIFPAVEPSQGFASSSMLPLRRSRRAMALGASDGKSTWRSSSRSRSSGRNY